MRKRYVAAAVAFLAPVVIMGGMFLFMSFMRAKEKEWMGLGRQPSEADLFVLAVARWWANYWYVAALMIVPVCLVLGVVLALGGANKPGPPAGRTGP